MFNIETIVKQFSEDAANTSRTFVVYDCCNTPLSGHKALLEAVGGRGEEGIADPSNSSFLDQEDPTTANRYIEFSTAKRGQTAASDDKNAEKLYKWLKILSEREPAKGFLEMPGDIAEIPGGN